jgi:hypothetical protein
MCTHLHVDHVGWNTKLENGRWVPTFPNARYLFAKREYAHWENEHKTQGKETNGGSFDDSVLPVVEAGKAVMIDSDHQPDPMLTIKDYPGHTPGSIAINLKDGGRQACFSGDIMHHPIQVYHPTGRASSAPTRSCRRRAGAGCSRTASRAARCSARRTSRRQCGYIKAAGQCLPHRLGCRQMTGREEDTGLSGKVAIVSGGGAAGDGIGNGRAAAILLAPRRHQGSWSPTSTRSWRSARRDDQGEGGTAVAEACDATKEPTASGWSMPRSIAGAGSTSSTTMSASAAAAAWSTRSRTNIAASCRSTSRRCSCSPSTRSRR